MGLLSLPIATWFIATGVPSGALPPQPAPPLAAAIPAQSIQAQSIPAQTIATRPDPEQRMTIAVRIGDKGPFRFLVDTGAQSTVLTDRIAAQLGLAPGDERQLSGVAGVLRVATVALRDVRIGRRSFDQRHAPVLSAANIDADGILGIDALQGTHVLLDFRHNVMTISDSDADTAAPAPDGAHEIIVTAHRRSGQLIVTHARIDGMDTAVVIDTGSEVSIGNRALQNALARRQPTEPAQMQSVTGQVITAEISGGHSLMIDTLQMTGLVIAYVDAPAFAALRLDRHPALLLGMRELRTTAHVEVDYARRKVLFGVGG